MQLVIQFQTFYNNEKIQLKINKRNKGITELKIAPLVLFNLSFGHVSLAFHFELVTTLYNVCSVHRGMFSTSGGVQYIGGIP